MLLLLKKKKQEMSLWLKMCFQREKWRWDNQIFIYKITLGELLLIIVDLEKVNPVRMIWSSYQTFFSLIGRARNWLNKWLRGFLNEYDVELIIYF